MDGDDCSFPPDSLDGQSQRGSVASSATLTRGTVIIIVCYLLLLLLLLIISNVANLLYELHLQFKM